MEFEVEVEFRNRLLYRVEAPDQQEAEKAATDRWRRGDPSDCRGFDWAELDLVAARVTPERSRQAQDEELALRFVRERERLITRIGGGLLDPTFNDAISAGQLAADLGWLRPGRAGSQMPDIARGAQTLERLCQKRRLVCFERARVRSGERGSVRLYSTPEHLERLSATIEGRDRQVAS
jgi:hypothetical protein